MSIKPRGKAGIYQIDFYTPSGERFSRSAKTSNRKDAQELHDQLKAGFWRQEKLGEQPAYCWGQAVSLFLADRQNLRSLDDIKDILSVLTSIIGNKTPVQTLLTRSTVTMLKVKLREPRTRVYSDDKSVQYQISDARLNKYLTYFGAVIKAAGSEPPELGLVTLDNEDRVVWLTHEQADALMVQLPDHLAVLARFSLATGLRQKNATHLEWTRVDMESKLAWIVAADFKNKKSHSVPLNRDALMVLQKQQGLHPRWVFPYRRHTDHTPGILRIKGAPIDQPAGAAWRKACLRANIIPGLVHGLADGDQFRWHDLRHTWATWHVRNGTPLPVLQKLGGWSSIKQVMKYAHVALDHVAAYADNVMQSSDQLLRVVK